MRDDMYKVIVERPRRGWRTRKLNRARIKRAGEDYPKRIGVKRQRATNQTQTKWLNENLAPLERYLNTQVGRPWDKVYAEIRANLHPDHTVKQHVLEHVWDFVYRVRIGREGEWLWEGSWGQPTAAPWRRNALYVHPVDGLLKRWKSKKKKPGRS